MTNTRRRNSATIPFGWDLHPGDASLLVENDDLKQLIQDLREWRESYSLRELVDVVYAHTGRKLTPRGLDKVIKRGY